MIKKIFLAVWRLFFITSSDVDRLSVALESTLQRLSCFEEQNTLLRQEIAQKTKELHMFIDAMLIEQGRAPLYLTPTALKAEREELAELIGKPEAPKMPKIDPLRRAKGARQWSNVASGLETRANQINGGV